MFFKIRCSYGGFQTYGCCSQYSQISAPKFYRACTNTGYQLLFAVLNNIRRAPIFRAPHMIAPRLPGVKVLYLHILVEMNHSPTGFWLFPSACHTCENRNIPEVHLHITHLYSKHVFIIYIYNIKNQYEYVDMVFPRFCLKPKANSSLWMSPTSGSKYRRAGCNLGLATTTASRCISGGQFMNKRSNNMNRYT